jgi:hypothetical protein
MSSSFPVIKAHHFEIHNIKEGHDMNASVGDMFVKYAEAFKKTKTAENKIIIIIIIINTIFATSKCRQKEITRSHNIRLSFHFNEKFPRYFQLLNPIISKCIILKTDMTPSPLWATHS